MVGIDVLQDFEKIHMPLAHDQAVIGADLKAVSFTVVRTHVVKLTGKLGSALDAAIGLCQGTPMRNEIEAHDPVVWPKRRMSRLPR